MKKTLQKIVALALFAGISAGVLAQETAAPAAGGKMEKFPMPKMYRSWTVGINLGLLAGHTDFGVPGGQQFGDYNLTLGYGLLVSKAFTHTVGAQFRLNMGSLKGSREFTLRNRKYTHEHNTKIQYQVSGHLMLNVGNISYVNRPLKKFHWYFCPGAGLISFDPNSTLNGKDIPEGEERPDTSTLKWVSWGVTKEIVFPLAFGFKYKLGKSMTIGGEYVPTILFSDKIDDYKVPFSNSDLFSYFNVHFSYSFGKKQKEIEWVNPLDELYTEMAHIRNKMDSLVGDKDGDGVADLYDKDNATPAGVKVYGDGTSNDVDGDGVPDASDADPFSTRGAQVDATGKELDADADGVYDIRDLEPNTPKGVMVNFQGVTIKAQQDVANFGGGGIVGYEKYLPLVFFDFNKYAVKAQYHEGLAALARIMNANPGVKVNLFGNCDAVGTESINTKLGQNRAEAVRDYLANVYGIDPGRFICESKGKTEPFSNKSNKKDKDPLNRRVDYKIN